MATAQLTRHEVDVRDVEYIRHGNKGYQARVYVPKGKGPFPLVIDIHGGAWVNKDRLADEGTDTPLAKTGVVVASLDFRMPGDGEGCAFPASLQDINYAIRFFKSRAAEYNIALGERRAQAVKKALILLGASESQLSTVSYGEERPSADGHDEAAWAQKA